MISNRCARESLLINCNSIISKNYLRFLVDNNDDKYEWMYWPITLRVTNAVNYDYSAGFKPDIEWNEYDLTQNPTDALLPLGDPDEFMLGKAISLITGVKRSARGMNTLSKSIMRGESVYQSTERHATGGMLMVPEGKDN